MDKPIKTLGIYSLSQSRVPQTIADRDKHADHFRHHPLVDAGPFTFFAAAALAMKVRERARVINAVALVATNANCDAQIGNFRTPA